MRANLNDNSIVQPRVALLHENIRDGHDAAGGNDHAHPPVETPAPDLSSPSRSTPLELRQPRQRPPESEESTVFPYIPRKRQERSGLLIDYLYLPAAQEAGDQVDFLILGENRVGVLLADVSGELPEDSAPVLKTVLRSNSTGLSPAASLRYLEHGLAESGAEGFSLTAFYAIFDQNKRLLHFASAGHLPMLVYRPGLGKIFVLNTPGAPFGLPLTAGTPAPALNGSARVESEKAALKQNDLLVLYSDGLLATRGTSGEYFGRQRLVEFIARHGELEPTAFLMELRGLLQKFTGGQPAQDDITVIAVKNVLRNLDKPHPDAADSDLVQKFMSTDQEQAILELLRANPRAGVEEIMGHLADTEYDYLTQEQVTAYLEQNGRWLQPWPSREQRRGTETMPAGGETTDPRAGEKSAARRLQEELIAAFPIRPLLAKQYMFKGDSPRLARALQHYNNGDYDQALAVFNELRPHIKASATTHCFFGNLQLLRQKPEEAQREYFAALNHDQRCSHALLALSYVALLEAEYIVAVESLATALRFHANLPDYQAFLQTLIAALERRENRTEWLV